MMRCTCTCIHSTMFLKQWLRDRDRVREWRCSVCFCYVPFPASHFLCPVWQVHSTVPGHKSLKRTSVESTADPTCTQLELSEPPVTASQPVETLTCSARITCSQQARVSWMWRWWTEYWSQCVTHTGIEYLSVLGLPLLLLVQAVSVYNQTRYLSSTSRQMLGFRR